MAEQVTLYGPDGRPIQRARLKEEVAAPTVTGVRSPIGGHPAQGLTPQRLAVVLRDAEEGDPTSQWELAEEIEERYLWYQGVLGTRKRAVTQLEITVEAATDEREDVYAADLVRDWLKRDELNEELFDVLDAIGKGISFTEQIWQTDGGLWYPALVWRDPRWFDFDQVDRRTPLLRGESGQLEPLAPYKWIVHTTKAKSGLPVRGGLVRGVAWVYLFQAFGWKDWLVFLNRYGMPMRLGKYGPGASEADKETLLRAVRALASDFAGIIPASMAVELIETSVSGNVTAFRELIQEADTRVSIAVLGQTLTTQVKGGSLAAANVHNDVRSDIERADAIALAATLNRDTVRPLIDLNMGPRKRYPRILIARPSEVDREALREDLKVYVPMGLKVGMSSVRDIVGLPDPDADEELLRAPGGGQAEASPDDGTEPPGESSGADDDPAHASTSAVEGAFNGSGRAQDPKGASMYPETGRSLPTGASGVSLQGVHARAGGDRDETDDLVDEVDAAAAQAMDAMIDAIRRLVEEVDSLDDLQERLLALYPDLDAGPLADLLRLAMTLAELQGRAEIANG